MQRLHIERACYAALFITVLTFSSSAEFVEKTQSNYLYSAFPATPAVSQKILDYGNMAPVTESAYLSRRKAEISKVQQLAETPEDKIDMGMAALTLAKEFMPDLDIELYSRRIDEMVWQVKATANGSHDPRQRILAINHYLYNVLGIQYDFSDPTAQKMKNRLINELISTKRGSCASMPVLYMVIAQRLGYPIYPVTPPRHTFLRYVDANFEQQNIEATSGGGYIPEDEYMVMMPTSQKGIETGAYFRTLTYKEYLGEMIAENAYHWAKLGPNRDLNRAIRYLHMSVKLNPRSPATHRLLAKCYEAMVHLNKDDPDYIEPYIMMAQNSWRRAHALGLTWIDAKEDYIQQQAKKIQDFRARKKPQVQIGAQL